MDRHDEIQPGKDGAESSNKYSQGRRDDVGIQVMRAERGGEGPSRIDAAENHAERVKMPATT